MVNRKWLTVFGFMISRLFGPTVTARTLKNTVQSIVWMFELLMIITVIVNRLWLCNKTYIVA